MKLETLHHIHEILQQTPKSFHDCIIWTRLKFEDLFNHQIQQLLHNLPLDKLTPEGTLFWSGAKKPPYVIDFNINDPLHLEFLLSVSCLRCQLFGISFDSCELNIEYCQQIISTIKVVSFRLVIVMIFI